MKKTVFDAGYYRKYYENSRTSVVTRAQAKTEVAFVIAFCSHIGVEIKRFADVGAGTGWWAAEFRRQYRKCREMETSDASESAAARYGHKLISADKVGGRPADLIVCRDVLRYLDDRTAKAAITRLAAKCRGVLYLHVVTRDDEVDEEMSDMSGYFRSARWYLRALKSAGFRNAGMGLFVSDRHRGFDPFSIEVPAP